MLRIRNANQPIFLFGSVQSFRICLNHRFGSGIQYIKDRLLHQHHKVARFWKKINITKKILWCTSDSRDFESIGTYRRKSGTIFRNVNVGKLQNFMGWWLLHFKYLLKILFSLIFLIVFMNLSKFSILYIYYWCK